MNFNRTWHRLFVDAIGHRVATQMTDADKDLMRTLRSQAMSPNGAAEQISQRITARNVQALND